MKFQLLVAAVVLQGCATSEITDVDISGMSIRLDSSCDGRSPLPRPQCSLDVRGFAEIGKPIVAFPGGHGTCAFAFVDFGDGSPRSDFTNQAVNGQHLWRVPHTYTGWPGKKTVRVTGAAGCFGEVTQDISVGFGDDGIEDLRASFRPDPTRFCSEIRSNTTHQLMPLIRKGTGVRIETDGHTFNYGAPNQTFDASGDATAIAPPGYPFPGLKKFSLVYRIGTQAVQGEAGPVVFVANQTGNLEVCVNDNPSYLSDNTGIMLVTITVNERSALIP